MNDKVAKDASSRNAQVVIAYGFDKIGFETPNEDIALSEYASIRFVNYGGSARIDTGDGVIIPQGIFEDLEETEIMEEVFLCNKVKRHYEVLVRLPPCRKCKYHDPRVRLYVESMQKESKAF